MHFLVQESFIYISQVFIICLEKLDAPLQNDNKH